MSAVPESAAGATPRCPLCDAVATHKTTMPLDAKTFRPTVHGAIYHCPGCALGFVHPRPTAAETAAFYELDAYYTQGASHMVQTASPGLASRLRTHLAWRFDASEALARV